MAPRRAHRFILEKQAAIGRIEWLERLPKAIIVTAIATTILLIVAFDYTTTTDVSIAAFYLVPISLAAVTLVSV